MKHPIRRSTKGQHNGNSILKSLCAQRLGQRFIQQLTSLDDTFLDVISRLRMFRFMSLSNASADALQADSILGLMLDIKVYQKGRSWKKRRRSGPRLGDLISLINKTLAYRLSSVAAGVQPVPGRDIPRASMQVLMVFAVYMPAQV